MFDTTKVIYAKRFSLLPACGYWGVLIEETPVKVNSLCQQP
jgi:hypothetical protein